MLSETSLSAITAFLNCPEAPLFTGNFNKDLDIESKIVLQMDNIIQEYTGEKDGMIKSSLGLIAGRNMKGAIPFKEFTTIFSSTRFLNGFYNFKEGDIYAKSTFIVRSDHSRVAARMANYWYNCTNPAFGLSKGQLLDNEVYLEVPNSHTLDAYRVGSGAECEEHQVFAPLHEMTMRKAIETVFEAISSSIV
ncbi:hypothetical protein TrLO_g2167 [Triparma laevis f. longispina]|uniref:Uncharacterized protein n=1 Tax=Triparma laevis f. longispina TaxID=1714387 RepID=A0A9W7FUW1_9STRA|nr:hypothetical protein TrLO_g2167 [Triparma laevis f. longispina]